MITIFSVIEQHSRVVKERGVAYNMFSDRLIGEICPSNTAGT